MFCDSELCLFLFSCSILSPTVQLIPRLYATLHIHFCTQARAHFLLSSQKTYPHRWTLCIPQINRTACKITCIALRIACMKEILDIYVKIIGLHIHIMVRERMMPIRNSRTGSHIPGSTHATPTFTFLFCMQLVSYCHFNVK